MTTPAATDIVLALVSAAGAPVLSGALDLPEAGQWTASLEVDMDAPPAKGTPVDIIIAPSTLTAVSVTYPGTVVWGAPWQGRSRFWMVGGAGGLRGVVAARSYVQGPVPLTLTEMLGDLMAETGETLTTGLELDGYTLGQWSRTNGRASTTTGTAALQKLCDAFGLVWRFMPDGTLWVGPLAYPVNPAQPYVSDPGDDGADQAFVLAPDDATIAPATTVLGRAVNRIVYAVGSSSLRATCWYGTSERDDFAAAVRSPLTELPYLPSFAATVVSQRTSGLLEVICDDARIGPLDNVLMLAGGPAMAYQMAQGQRVRILFASGDPRLYYAIGCEQDPTATQGIARVADSVACGTLTATSLPGGGPVTFTYVPPTGAPAPPGPSAALAGVISSGSRSQLLTPG